jgi:hypothetical protein
LAANRAATGSAVGVSARARRVDVASSPGNGTTFRLLLPSLQ